ncbi:MAG TPA: hypothetical protein VF585_12035 [Chthoniobacterales bacterium]|jgi:hypothetical protein
MKALLLILILLAAPFTAKSGQRPENALPKHLAGALESATEVTLFSLDPKGDSAEANDSHPRLVHWRILGKTNIVDVQQRRAAVTSLMDAILNFNGLIAKCFNPRHALRVKTSTRTYDFIICFECNSAAVWEGKKRLTSVGITGTQKPLDDIFTAANVPLPKSP